MKIGGLEKVVEENSTLADFATQRMPTERREKGFESVFSILMGIDIQMIVQNALAHQASSVIGVTTGPPNGAIPFKKH